jgi:hypothetical protein
MLQLAIVCVNDSQVGGTRWTVRHLIAESPRLPTQLAALKQTGHAADFLDPEVVLVAPSQAGCFCLPNAASAIR